MTRLSARETEVLELLAAGHTNLEVGRALGLAEETVKTHVRHVCGKLGARNRTHAVALGIRLALVA